MAHTDMRQIYDVAVSRAVARLNVLLEYCLPFVRVGGYFLALKGPIVDEEIAETKNVLKILGGKIIEVIPTHIPNTDLRHNIVVIQKTGSTPKEYPRVSAKIAKKAL
jgi:16S rRNA (guanine527-N7)-methyltransferase